MRHFAAPRLRGGVFILDRAAHPLPAFPPRSGGGADPDRPVEAPDHTCHRRSRRCWMGQPGRCLGFAFEPFKGACRISGVSFSVRMALTSRRHPGGCRRLHKRLTCPLDRIVRGSGYVQAIIGCDPSSTSPPLVNDDHHRRRVIP